MIKSILLKNFRSYKDNEIVFHPKITLIKGEGLSGKSNIRRAIELVKNYSYSRNNRARFAIQQDMYIEIKTSENELRLSLDKNENVYFEVDSQKFKRKKTPDEVIKALALDTINIQGQLEQPFIIENNRSQLSKTINKITGISNKDSIIKEINSELKINRAFLERDRLDRDRLEKERELLGDLEKIKISIKRAKSIKKERLNLQYASDEVKSILRELKESNRNIELLENKIKIGIRLDLLEEIRSKRESKESLRKDIEKLLRELNEINDNITNLKKDYKKTIRKYIEEMKEVSICSLCFSSIDSEKISLIRRRLKDEVNSIK